MTSESIEKWAWVLIYGGIGTAMLGFWGIEREATVAYVLSVLGGLMVAGGVLLIWLRSRTRTRKPDATPGAPP